MKATGIIRKIDQLGRVVLPIELRNNLNLPVGAPMEVFVRDDEIVLKAYKPGCYACGTVTKDLVEVCNVHICKNCAGLVARALELWKK